MSDIVRHLLNSPNVNTRVVGFVDIVSELVDFLCGLHNGVDDKVDYCALKIKSTSLASLSDELRI